MGPLQIPQKTPPGYWADLKHQRQFFDELGAELGVKQLDDWENSSIPNVRDKVRANGGKWLLDKYYSGSLSRALRAVYPEHPWPPLQTVRRGHWDDVANQRAFLESIREDLGVVHLDDWCSVTVEDVMTRGGRGLLKRHRNSLVCALRAIYPERPWKSYKFTRYFSFGASALTLVT
eukprot:GEZU01023884.1.p1 GENE.GEZU01023884.1~~GEZU01023884.1.p1  ORF type:complete len:176 (+),score=33.57 GEZU01023884.1:114-641(+)